MLTLMNVKKNLKDSLLKNRGDIVSKVHIRKGDIRHFSQPKKVMF